MKETKTSLRLKVIVRGTTRFIPLPSELWQDADGCCCVYCSADGTTKTAYWDTMALSTTEPHGRTWMVHAPELHGVQRKREKSERGPASRTE